MKASFEKELSSNRRAYHNYEILETFEAGILLLGSEIKSLRNQGGNIQDGYVLVSDNSAWLKNVSITPYRFTSYFSHEERRDRKLLLHKRELKQLKNLSQEKGLTIIPLALYLKGGRAKVKIGVAKGKKLHDKRASIRAREETRKMDQALKRNYR